MVSSSGLKAPVLFLSRLCKSAVLQLKLFQNHRPQLRNAARSERENHVSFARRGSNRGYGFGE